MYENTGKYRKIRLDFLFSREISIFYFIIVPLYQNNSEKTMKKKRIPESLWESG